MADIAVTWSETWVEGYRARNTYSGERQLLTGRGRVTDALVGTDADDDRLFGTGNGEALFLSDARTALTGADGTDATALRRIIGIEEFDLGGGDDILDLTPREDAADYGLAVIVDGGDGNDVLFAGDGDDDLNGGRGDDYVAGGPGDDTVRGGEGRDRLRGWEGDDSLSGEEAVDTLHGGAGEDTLAGGLADDLLVGGAGDDRLDGGPGSDELRGGTDTGSLERLDGGDEPTDADIAIDGGDRLLPAGDPDVDDAADVNTIVHRLGGGVDVVVGFGGFDNLFIEAGGEVEQIVDVRASVDGGDVVEGLLLIVRGPDGPSGEAGPESAVFLQGFAGGPLEGGTSVDVGSVRYDVYIVADLG